MRSCIDFKPHHKYEDRDGRILILIGALENVKLALINVYAPNVDTPSSSQIFLPSYETSLWTLWSGVEILI